MNYLDEAKKHKRTADFMSGLAILLMPIILYALTDDILRTVIATCAVNFWMMTNRNVAKENKLAAMYEQAHLEQADADPERVIR